MKTFTHTFEISDEVYALLLSIQKEGYAEYRDTRWESLEDFRSDDELTDFGKEMLSLQNLRNGKLIELLK
jgi:hypothetical protein